MGCFALTAKGCHLTAKNLQRVGKMKDSWWVSHFDLPLDSRVLLYCPFFLYSILLLLVEQYVSAIWLAMSPVAQITSTLTINSYA
jgi:hypothetical protein